MPKAKATCHPERDLAAKGMCSTCYGRECGRRRRQDPAYNEKQKFYARQWRKDNPGYDEGRPKRRYATSEKHRAYVKAYAKRYRAANPERAAAWHKTYREKDPERWRQMVCAYALKRYNRKRGAAVCDFTPDQWEQMKVDYDHTCFYCDTKPEELTQDHMLPLSRGGDHTASNIVPCCRSCNSRKRTKTAEEFLGLVAA